MSVDDAIRDMPTAMESSRAQYSPIRSEVISRDGAAIQIASAVTAQERYLKSTAHGSMTMSPATEAQAITGIRDRTLRTAKSSMKIAIAPKVSSVSGRK